MAARSPKKRSSARSRSKTSRKSAPKKSTPKPSGSRTASRAKTPARRSILWRQRRALFLVALVLTAGVAGAGFVVGQVELPDEDPLLQSTFICAADVTEECNQDNAIAKLAGEEDRVSVPLEEIPQTFIEAVLAAEDRQFWSHAGIDPVGIARAIYQEVRGGGSRQGGSTITQQYAKNAFLSSERTITRKLKEAVLAVKLEREFSKQEILERYLNTVYFGRGAYGVEAAARSYFGVSIRNVDLPQAAYLAALIRSPESTDVAHDAEVAEFRRNSVLNGMLEEGFISADEHAAASAAALTAGVRERSQREGITMFRGSEFGAEYYVEYIRRLLYDTYGADVVNGGGLRVYTSLDMDMQQAAYESVYGFLDRDDDPAGALVSVDHVGRVVALVGGKDFDASEVNLALGSLAGGSGRQPGSAFKPIVLATALGQDISARSKFINENEVVLPRANNGEDWEVSNYSDGSEDLVDLVQATRVSSNTVYAQLMLEVGPKNVVDTAERIGVRTELPAVNSLTLGSGEVSVLDMASAYSTFSRRGQYIEPVFITKVEQLDGGGRSVLEQASTSSEKVMRSGDADQVNWILRQVVLGGTATGANFGIPIAGKTGTTQDYRDAWFVGYTPKLTTAVWMGFPDPDADGNPRFMEDVRGRDVTGGSFPAQIWRAFMERATGGQSHGLFTEPPPFGGTILNADLTTTTTTLPICDPVDDGDDEAGTPDSGTPDTEPCRTTTTTTDPDESTTTTTEDDGSSTTSSTTSSSTTSSTTTSQPGSSSTTAAPTTTEFLP